MRVGKSGVVGSEGGRSLQRDMLSARAFWASGIRDWEMRIEARVWRGSGDVGAVRRASVMRRSQVASASDSHLWGDACELRLFWETLHGEDVRQISHVDFHDAT